MSGDADLTFFAIVCHLQAKQAPGSFGSLSTSMLVTPKLVVLSEKKIDGIHETRNRLKKNLPCSSANGPHHFPSSSDEDGLEESKCVFFGML